MNALARLLGGLLLVWTTSSVAVEWRMDPAASRLTFQATYERAEAPGVFKQFDTCLRFDPEHPRNGLLQVTVMIGSADMDSADVNTAIRQPEWFGTAGFPQADFRSSDIRQTGPGRYLARGELSVKGNQQEVAVPFTWEQSGKAAIMSGELVLNRTAFGIGTGEWASGDVIGLEVKVRFTVRLHQVE